MNTNTEQAIEECLERVDHTRALLESQVTALRRLCIAHIEERQAAGDDSPQRYDLRGLGGHVLGMAIVALRIDGAIHDDIKMLVDLTLEEI